MARTNRIPREQQGTPYAGGPPWLISTPAEIYSILKPASSQVSVKRLSESFFVILKAISRYRAWKQWFFFF
jgi:hypothetical protein